MKFPCPHCGQRIEADADMVGMQFNCPSCSRPFTVPAAAPVVVPPPLPPVIVPPLSCIPDTAPPDPNALRCAIVTDGAALTMSFDVMELVDEMKNRIEKRLLKKNIAVQWQTSGAAALQIHLVAVNQGNQFLRWLIPFVAPAVFDVQGQIAVGGNQPQPFHYIQKAHFGLFGGSPRYMLKVCTRRAADKIAKDVARASGL